MTIATFIVELRRADDFLDRCNWPVFLVVVLLCGIPKHSTFAVAATAMAALLIWRKDSRLSSIGQLSLALAWIDFWGPSFYLLFDRWFLSLETMIAFEPLSWFTQFTRDGNVIDNGAGHSIMVVEGCSAFRNTMTAAFVWLCSIKIQRLEVTIHRIVVLAFALGAVVVINSARLALLSISAQSFFFWHDGLGFEIAKFSMIGVVFVIFFFGIKQEPNRKLLSGRGLAPVA
ncbi:archaeosortase/exosortase family protein [Bradyrhizobium sp. LTSPM299]|uniref:archaeosortase/exosortase family protein n=1 Tax=Bradyrhizobium sp. LTSPM299 TaxID=1619233 RepID=UPI0018CD3905|nr:archaeosortase/exosortase family protein [Bradyrhizobium sp. LTSPM299]